MSATAEPIRLGVLGLGRAFTLMLPTFLGDPRVRLVAAYDPHPGARAAFETTFGGVALGDEQSVCDHPDVEWVYLATPHQMHARHVQLAAERGKHVLVEKPMALSMADADTMVEVCARAGTRLIVGHSHSFNAPVLLAHELIASGRYGAVRMVHALQYTDFLYRPRRPEELDTARGGGVVFSQAAHQVDIVRLLAGGETRTVRALMGRWDASRPTEGAYSALLQFANGAFASISYNGYGFYDSDTQMDGVGEMGTAKARDAHQATRARLAAATSEAAEVDLKAARNFGGTAFTMPTLRGPDAAQHFGPVIVSCDLADLRLTPTGVEVVSQAGIEFVPIKLPEVPRAEVIDELWRVARDGALPAHGGEWSRATLEVCLAMLKSEASGTDIPLERQVAAPS
ncbi:Gfo/Idh/MocA family protein [Ottowia oryzae]|uniref:4,5-dihydroxyphthalate dehydrogenase n=1 Tax=Ottowia oryzae TaxID=2109914 RepID=A0A2S0MFY4_9BURK|nr:Gfo/Idh/MocA family oxidoreductase [Ottowia oryzae]AVO34623.1 4,5-dihydroxyphthalate dehydrogenase [Ottowia oryzae]